MISNTHRRDESGFTLLELLLTLSIIAGLVTASTIALSGSVVKLQASGYVGEIADIFREGQIQAIQTGQEAHIIIDLDARSLSLYPLGKVSALSEKLRVSIEIERTNARANGATIVFYPDGSSTGGRMLIRAGVRNYEVEIDWLTGLTRQRRLADEI